MAEEAFYGLAGEFVRLVEPETEADSSALLIHFLVAAGVYIGRTGFCLADGRRHFSNLYAVVVGHTAKARKGTAWAQVRNLFERVDSGFIRDHTTSGMSSGQGLIWGSSAWPSTMLKRSGGKERTEKTEIRWLIPESRIKGCWCSNREFARALKMAQLTGTF